MTIAIESVDDPRVAEYRSLPDAELLRASGLFIAEGRLVVRHLLTASRYAARSLLVSPVALEGLRDILGERAALPVYVMPVERLTAVVGFNIHRGCLAIGERHPAPELAAWWREASPARLAVVLERVGNADNMGAVFRNALAFGAGGVLLSPGCCDPLYRKSIRVSMGAALRLPYAVDEHWPDGLRMLKAAGVRVLALTPQSPAHDLDTAVASIHPAGGAALMLGHEGEGLSAEAMRLADERARIELRADVDSLNVATAAGIALHACRRRLGWQHA
jgi:tRNA G18 (ribose-2'-O)-methylase SpoU